MIQEQKCIICNQSLEKVEEIDSNLCTKHELEVASPKYLIITCWECGKILGTSNKREVVRGVKIKDDYLFSKVCPYCSNASAKSLPFVTINTNFSDNAMCVNTDGKLQKWGMLKCQ